MSATLSSTLCVAFRTCAVAIRASSCVSLSSLFNPSSMSVLPTNFFRYFSENIFVNGDNFVQRGLTCSALLHLLCGNCKNREDLDQYRGNRIHHFLIRWHPRVNIETSKKCLYTLKDFDESVSARTNIFCCL